MLYGGSAAGILGNIRFLVELLKMSENKGNFLIHARCKSKQTMVKTKEHTPKQGSEEKLNRKRSGIQTNMNLPLGFDQTSTGNF